FAAGTVARYSCADYSLIEMLIPFITMAGVMEASTQAIQSWMGDMPESQMSSHGAHIGCICCNVAWTGCGPYSRFQSKNSSMPGPTGGGGAGTLEPSSRKKSSVHEDSHGCAG